MDIIEGRPDFDSLLGRWDNPQGGTIALTLKIKAHILLVPAGTYRFVAHVPHPTNPTQIIEQQTSMTISSAPHDAASRFQSRFSQAVDRHWNNKLWLVHGESTRRRGDGARAYNVRCRVGVEHVPLEEAHLVMELMWQPTGDGAAKFRQNCALGGLSRPNSTLRGAIRNALGLNQNPRDMQLLDDACDGRTCHFAASDCTCHSSSRHPFEQNVAAHEFGHYLGLPHACASAGGLNADAQYCIGTTISAMSDQMAVGNDVRVPHATPWLNRLREHGYGPRNWRAQTTPPRGVRFVLRSGVPFGAGLRPGSAGEKANGSMDMSRVSR